METLEKVKLEEAKEEKPSGLDKFMDTLEKVRIAETKEQKEQRAAIKTKTPRQSFQEIIVVSPGVVTVSGQLILIPRFIAYLTPRVLLGVTSPG